MNSCAKKSPGKKVGSIDGMHAFWNAGIFAKYHVHRGTVKLLYISLMAVEGDK